MTKKFKSKSKSKRKGGKKNCSKTCKAMFVKEIQTDKRFKALNKISSFFGNKQKLDNDLNIILDSKDIQNDEVFKNCVTECKKTK